MNISLRKVSWSNLRNGREGLARALGGQNGFAVLQNIRAKADTPVLMLTARGEEVG